MFVVVALENQAELFEMIVGMHLFQDALVPLPLKA